MHMSNEAHVVDALRTAVNYSYEHVEFYKFKLKKFLQSGESIRSFEDFSKLPFTAKEDVQRTYPC